MPSCCWPKAGRHRRRRRNGPTHHRPVAGGLRRGRACCLGLRADRGFPPALGETQQAELRAAVQELPTTVGIGLANWNWKVVRQFVSERCGISLCRSCCLVNPRPTGAGSARLQPGLQRGRGGMGLGERGGDGESVSGKQGPGTAESRQFPLRPSQPERRSQTALPDRPAIKSRSTPARLSARFRAHPKYTSHFGFGLVPAV